MNDALDLRALKFACQRIAEFAHVNRPRSDKEKIEATTLWLEFLGLDYATTEYLHDWCEEEFMPGMQGPIMIGLALGLYIRQYEREHPE